MIVDIHTLVPMILFIVVLRGVYAVCTLALWDYLYYRKFHIRIIRYFPTQIITLIWCINICRRFISSLDLRADVI